MVLYFTSNSTSPPVVIYTGEDKHVNEDLLKYGFPEDFWFHVDKLSSAHVYLRWKVHSVIVVVVVVVVVVSVGGGGGGGGGVCVCACVSLKLAGLFALT